MRSNNEKLVIGIIGKQRAGKDTVGEYIVNKYGFTKVSFAEPVKDLARDYFGMTDKDRRLLIDISMSLRAIDNDVWLNKARENIVDFTVITDVRFENEYEYIQSLPNGYLIRVDAEQRIRAEREGYSLDHENDDTETRLLKSKVDYVIENNKSIPDALLRVDMIMEFIMG